MENDTDGLSYFDSKFYPADKQKSITQPIPQHPRTGESYRNAIY